MDLAPGRSFIEYATSSTDIPLFAISWRNPTPAGSRLGSRQVRSRRARRRSDAACDNHRQPRLQCASAYARAGSPTALTAGASGGVGRSSASTQRRCSSRCWIRSLPSMTGMFATEDAIKAARDRNRRKKGVLDGNDMARVFAWLRPNDLVWNYWVNNYLLGRDPAPFDILLLERRFDQPAGEAARRLSRFVSAQSADPWRRGRGARHSDRSARRQKRSLPGCRDDRSHLRVARLLSSDADVRRTSRIRARLQRPYPEPREPAGKLQSPLLHRRQTCRKIPTNGSRGAAENKGTWWDHWIKWLAARSGGERPAPASLGSERFKAGEPAPGLYVHERH